MTSTTAPDEMNDPAAAGLLIGGGEMGARMRAFDWSQTSLGPVDTWPQSLRSAVSILLPSGASIVLFWGPELVTLYNDGYRAVLGTKHPRVLGRPARETWNELWDAGLRGLIEGVVETGTAYWASDRPFFMERYGFSEETYFDISYDPVRDESGHVGGVFCIVSDTTERVVGARRLKTLRELSTQTTEDGRNAREACETAAAILARNPHDVAFALIYLFDEEAGSPATRLSLRGVAGLPPASPAAPSHIDLAAPDCAWPLAAVKETRRAHTVADLTERFGPLSNAAWPESTHTAVLLPIHKPAQDELAGFLIAGVSPRRPLDERYRDFLDLVASQLATNIANARVIDEQRKRHEALAELDRTKTAFFSNVSHEFRTPLTLMLGPLDEVLSNDALPEATRSELEMVTRNGQRLLKLVNTLLDFSRIEAGRINATYEATDIATFTGELASGFRSTFERAGVELVVNSRALTAPVYVDREMWEKIVLNLVSNAFKFTFEGRVTVQLREKGERAELTVRDTGIGIPATELAHVFDRFHRVAGARGRSVEGSGIGLALVRELVSLHGGTVRVESEVGRGSTFTISLPFGRAHLPRERVREGTALAPVASRTRDYTAEAERWLVAPQSDATPPVEASSQQAAPAPVASRPAMPTRRHRILVADDNADMREYITRLLEHDYDVTAVADGEAALDRAREGAFDLVLSDVMMPGLDGFGLIRSLREDERTRSVPIVLLSARAGDEARIDGAQAGADDYLDKPFSAKELLARVGARLEITMLRREAEARAHAMADALRASQMRQQYVLALSDALRPLSDPIEVQAVACRVLGEHLDANRVTYFEVEGDEYVIERDFTHGTRSLAGRLPIAAFGPRLIESFMQGRTVVAPDTANDPDLTPEERAAYASIDVGAHLGVPLVKEGKFVAGLAVNASTARQWTSAEIALAEETAERTWAAVVRARSDQALRASEARLQLATTAGRVGIWSWDVSTSDIVVDRQLADIFGLDASEARTPVPVLVLAARVHPDDRDRMRAIVERALANHEPYEADFRVQVGAGPVRWVQARGRVERDAAGAPTRFSGVVNDVTDRKFAELSTRFLADLDRQLGEWGEPAAIERAAITATGAFLGASRCYFAHMRGNTLGQVTQDYRAPDVTFSVAGEHRVDAFVGEDTVARFLAGETFVNHDVSTHPATRERAANFIALGVRAFIITPIFFSGEWVGIMNVTSAEPRTWRDDEVDLLRQVSARVWPLIERARAMVAVRDSRARFDIVKDAARVGFWFCDLPFDTLDWDNRVKEHFWLPPDAVVTLDTFYGRIHPDDREATRRAIESSIEQHTQYDVEYRTVSPERQEKWIRAIGRSFYDAAGHPVRFDGVTVDITEAKRSEALLRENDRRKDEFLAMLAHELRNPLAPIRNAAQVLKLTGPADPSQQWASEVIERQAQHLTHLVDDLLDVSRITQGKITLQRESLDLEAIVHRAVEASRPLIDARKHRLRILLPDEPVYVIGDLTRLVQVVSNLVNNAAKYTDEGGNIAIEAAVERGEAVIRVRDDGMGLSHELLPLVFDLFTQADRTLDRSQGGLGIGLTLVRRLVEMHGGHVEAHSEGQGRGSEFVVWLPLAPGSDLTSLSPTKVEEAIGAARAPLRVLIVEDNVDSAEMLAFMLKLDGHEIQTAHDGLSAVTAARRYQPHVILCDIGLPGIDGYQVAQQLRGEPWITQARLIALSGYGQDEDRRRAREAGFDYHLVKPVQPQTLLALLDSIRNERQRPA